MEGLSLVDEKKKKRLFISRLLGVVISLAIVALLFCFYFQIIDEWILAIIVVLLSAMNFIVNSVIIGVKDSTVTVKLNLWISGIFFLAGAGFLTYGLMTGNLILF